MNEDTPQEPSDFGIPLNANGPAYTLSEDRHGVPLTYVAEKMGSAIEALHSHVGGTRASAMDCYR